MSWFCLEIEIVNTIKNKKNIPAKIVCLVKLFEYKKNINKICLYEFVFVFCNSLQFLRVKESNHSYLDGRLSSPFLQIPRT